MFDQDELTGIRIDFLKTATQKNREICVFKHWLAGRQRQGFPNCTFQTLVQTGGKQSMTISLNLGDRIWILKRLR